ncbi:uncharacterized protein (DUF2141 family) [Pseudomonas duriflava]|uniref:Uncharacterized protein (DUF2141 family) n=1 Tax=Pseudomonas duriflava TaxID=459528 RepID=A0A562QKF5_9PSED|nr:DUF2141 domain-containing protein [Pseudomonas duriflava]TWI56526.1 uncharacterized protein (DUF2141 family) [Pseudomonas duriflava]
MKRFLASLIGSAWLLGQAQAADLEVNFTQLKEPTGELLVAVFDSAAHWEASRPLVASAYVPVTATTVHHVFSSLKPGTYALSVIRDVNGNRELDTNFIGMPTEQYGYSNNPPLRMRKATFDETRFELKESGHVLQVELR